jgi:GNAT superfamily N-acetyltransferase
VLTVRSVVPGDVPGVARLVEQFMHDAFTRPWGGSAEALARDGFGAHFEMSVAIAADAELVGFAAWEDMYDLHHCVPGAHVIDLYVAPSHRGIGVALALLADVSAHVRDRGGSFLRGQALPARGLEHLYGRVAVLFPGDECNVGGRAFRALADLAGVPAREAIRRLPEKAWNYEP